LVERLAPVPQKPQPVIIERWLPYPEQKRRVIYQQALIDPSNKSQKSMGSLKINLKFRISLAVQ
jgi:hypothetical protein